jgi:hypothetical protein
MQVKNPWGHDNKSLLGMYQGASEGGECPLVVDTSTPSCGKPKGTGTFYIEDNGRGNLRLPPGCRRKPFLVGPER